MAGRRRAARPPQATVARERRLHLEQIRSYRFVAGRGPKRSATVTPAPLRYWQYTPPGPVALGITVGIVAVWLGVFGWVGGWPEVRSELPLALTAGAVVLALNVRRTTVSDHGLSIDVAGTRTASSSVVPLVLVQEVHAGPAPEGCPAARRGGWVPGRTRVTVRHLSDDGDAEQALTLWVRDAEAFASALRVALQR